MKRQFHIRRIPITFWIGVLICLAYLLAYMQRTGPGVVSDKLQRQFHVTSAVLGTVSSVQYFLYMMMQVPVGLSGDSLGPERLLVSGVLLDGVGTLLFSNAHTFTLLLVGRAIVGFGDALIWVNIVLIIGRHFRPQMFGAMLGITSTAGNVGALLTTIPFAALTSAVGWRGPFFALGLALVAVALLNFFVLRQANRRTSESPGVRIDKLPVLTALRQVVRDVNAWATFCCHFAAVGTYIGFVGLWAVPFFMDTYHVPRTGATVFTLVAFVGALVGSPLAGTISDRIGTRKVPYIVSQCLTTAAWLSIPMMNGHPPIWLMGVAMYFIGSGSGASLLTFAVIRDQTPTNRVGVTSGFANTGGFLSAVLLPVVYGGVIDLFNKPTHATTAHTAVSSHAFAMAFLVPAVFSFVGVVGSLCIRERKRSNTDMNEGSIPAPSTP